MNELTRLIELNRDEINKNKTNIKKNAEGVTANKEKIEQIQEASHASFLPLTTSCSFDLILIHFSKSESIMHQNSLKDYYV